MKHLRTILLLLAVCLTQISFSQNLQQKWDEGGKFKSAIAQVLAKANTEQEAETLISRLMRGDGEYITALDKQNIANGYFEKCKKKLAKWDEKLAAGKKVSSDDALNAANYYIIGYKKICNQDYAKALEYIKMCPQNPITQMYAVALQYQLSKDKAAAKTAISFIDKPSKPLSYIASQFGLADVYQEKVMSLIADKKQIIKRAVRSKDFATLLSYIPYDIPEVDSLFATNEAYIVIAQELDESRSHYKKRSIEDIEDFDDRNIIKINPNIWVGKTEGNVRWEHRDYTNYFTAKCIYIHEMPWTLHAAFDINKIAQSYPIKLQILAFAIKKDKDTYKILNYIKDLCCKCGKYNDSQTKNEQNMLKLIRSFQQKNFLASFFVAVMAQIYGQIGIDPDGKNIVYSPELKLELYNITKDIINIAPSLKDDEFLPVTISSNGKVTIKEGRENPDEIAKNIYEPIMNFIWAAYKQIQKNTKK